MNDEELKIIQKKELDILKEIIAVCERHNITYYAAGGTLLGTIRHQGFIPWDDDIDIEIIRPDYNKFIKYAKKELPSHLKLENWKLAPGKSKVPYLKVLDTTTEIMQNYASKPVYTNLYIDIFPFDGMPDPDSITGKLYKIKYLALRVFRNYADMDNIHMHRKNRPFIERALIKFGMLTRIDRMLDFDKIMRKSEAQLCKYNFHKSSYYISGYGNAKLREIMPSYYYGKGKKYKFEDIMINGPAKPERVLKQLYGDFMKMPPENERNLQHNTTVIKL